MGAVRHQPSTSHVPYHKTQWPVLSPRLFILYTADLEDQVAEHGVSFHAFADDAQLHVHCRRDEVTSAVLRLENCIAEISDWIGQSSQAECGQNGAALGRVTSWSGHAREHRSVLAA